MQGIVHTYGSYCILPNLILMLDAELDIALNGAVNLNVIMFDAANDSNFYYKRNILFVE